MLSKDYKEGYREAICDAFDEVTKLFDIISANPNYIDSKLEVILYIEGKLNLLPHNKFKDESNEQPQVHTNNDS